MKTFVNENSQVVVNDNYHNNELGEYCSSGSAAILIALNHNINYLLYFFKTVTET